MSKEQFLARARNLAARFGAEDIIESEASLKFDEESSTSSNEIYKSKEE